MSKWAHIVASIDVDTYIESNTIESDVKEMLKKAPKITGSEEDAHIFVNVLSGSNHITSCDCRNCEYGTTREYSGKRKGSFRCHKPEGYKCPEGRYQTRVVITVIGDLRDKSIAKTEKEWIGFKNFIENEIGGDGFNIRNCSCNIIDYWGVRNV